MLHVLRGVVLCLWVRVSRYFERSCGLHRKGFLLEIVDHRKWRQQVSLSKYRYTLTQPYIVTSPNTWFPPHILFANVGPRGQLTVCLPSPATDGILAALSKGWCHVPLVFFSLPYSLTIPHFLDLNQITSALIILQLIILRISRFSLHNFQS